MIEFVFKGVVFVVKRDDNGEIVYRDKAHTGGPWSKALPDSKNKFLHSTFRKHLQHAIKRMG